MLLILGFGELGSVSSAASATAAGNREREAQGR